MEEKQTYVPLISFLIKYICCVPLLLLYIDTLRSRAKNIKGRFFHSLRTQL